MKNSQNRIAWRELKLVHPRQLAHPVSVRTRFLLESPFLTANFEVTSPQLNTNPKFGKTVSQPGLWDWDVVELFVTVDRGHYFEFQISPLNQFFELKILEPRKRVDDGFKSGFSHSAKVSTSGWNAELKIPLSIFGANGLNTNQAPLMGNAFACLGTGASRGYFSLFLPRQDKPDFHLPQYFQKLF